MARSPFSTASNRKDSECLFGLVGTERALFRKPLCSVVGKLLI